MRVTGVITCHNYGDYVTSAIDSFYAQDYEPKQLVVVDDGSSDDSWEKIRAYGSAALPTVFRIDEPQGPSFAKNIAIEQAWDTTDIFAFLDADDTYLPGYVSKAVSLLQSDYGHPGIVYCDHLVADEVRHLEYYRPFRSFSLEGNLIVSKSVFQTVKGFDPGLRIAEAWDLMLRASRKFMILHIPEPLVSTRITHRSLRNIYGTKT
jgi:glycosyltransferase involved in cell wall biosynthesis